MTMTGSMQSRKRVPTGRTNCRVYDFNNGKEDVFSARLELSTTAVHHVGHARFSSPFCTKLDSRHEQSSSRNLKSEINCRLINLKAPNVEGIRCPPAHGQVA